LPTPRAREGNATAGRGSRASLHNAARGYLDGVVQEMYPTPDASAGTGGRVTNPEHVTDTGKDLRTGKKRTITLADKVKRQQMFPTPDTCAGGDGPSQDGRKSPRLQTFVRLFPTPNSRDYKDTGNRESLIKAAEKEGGQLNLPRAVAMYPTPASRDWKDSTASPAVVSRTDKLAGAVYHEEMYPTPLASDGTKCPTSSLARLIETGDRNGTRRGVTQDGRPCNPAPPGGQLNPTWVTWLMGYPLTWLHSSPAETFSEVQRCLGLTEESPSE